MLVVAILAALAWAATIAGAPDARRSTSRLTLVLLGLVAFNPVGSAFNDLGTSRRARGSRSPAGSSPPAAPGRRAASEMPHAAAAPA